MSERYNITLEINDDNISIFNINGDLNKSIVDPSKSDDILSDEAINKMKVLNIIKETLNETNFINTIQEKLNQQKALKKNEEPINESDDECLFGCDDCCDTEECDYEEEYEEGEYDYDACGSFIADIELNIGKICSNEDTIDDEMMQECWDKLLDTLAADNVVVENDDEVFETLKFKILEDGMTLVKAKGVECSVIVDIQASCLDAANDKRWSEFSSKVNSIDYLHNIRNEHVSEAD